MGLKKAFKKTFHPNRYRREQEQRQQAQLDAQRRALQEAQRRAEETARQLEQQKAQQEAERLAHEASLREQQLQSLQSRLISTRLHISDSERDVGVASEELRAVESELETVATQVLQEEEHVARFSHERSDPSVKRIVLLGWTGHGKSTLANRLCGDTSARGNQGGFQTSASLDSETEEVKKAIAQMGEGGPRISVVDTPGLNDSGFRDREHLNNIVSYLRGCGGVTQFVIVRLVSAPRFDDNQQTTLQRMERILGENFWNHVTVFLTRVGEGRDTDDDEEFMEAREELPNRIRRACPGAREVDADIPVFGIGKYNYAEVIPQFVASLSDAKYTCDGLVSPLDDLRQSLEDVRNRVVSKRQDVELRTQRLNHLRQQEEEIQASISQLQQQ